MKGCRASAVPATRLRIDLGSPGFCCAAGCLQRQPLFYFKHSKTSAKYLLKMGIDLLNYVTYILVLSDGFKNKESVGMLM